MTAAKAVKVIRQGDPRSLDTNQEPYQSLGGVSLSSAIVTAAIHQLLVGSDWLYCYKNMTHGICEYRQKFLK